MALRALAALPGPTILRVLLPLDGWISLKAILLPPEWFVNAGAVEVAKNPGAQAAINSARRGSRSNSRFGTFPWPRDGIFGCDRPPFGNQQLSVIFRQAEGVTYRTPGYVDTVHDVGELPNESNTN